MLQLGLGSAAGSFSLALVFIFHLLVYVPGKRNLRALHFDSDQGELRPLRHKGGFSGDFVQKRG